MDIEKHKRCNADRNTLILTNRGTDEKAREDIRRASAMRPSWIQKRILNDNPHPRRKSTEEVQRI